MESPSRWRKENSFPNDLAYAETSWDTMGQRADIRSKKKQKQELSRRGEKRKTKTRSPVLLEN